MIVATAIRALEDPRPPEIVLGFGDLTEGAIERGIATVADLLGGARPE